MIADPGFNREIYGNLLNPLTAFVAANGFGSNSYVNVVLVVALGLTAYYHDPLIPVPAAPPRQHPMPEPRASSRRRPGSGRLYDHQH
jgi:hypothetical protein